jgi:hypothetical protein
VNDIERRRRKHRACRKPRPLWHDHLPDIAPLRTDATLERACIDFDDRFCYGNSTARVEDYVADMHATMAANTGMHRQPPRRRSPYRRRTFD